MILHPAVSGSYDSSKLIADCPSDAIVGDMVYASGNKTGDVYRVSRCNIDTIHQRPIGMIISKASSTRCTVKRHGLIEGIYTGLLFGRHVFLGVGEGSPLTQIPPGPADSNVRYLQIAGIALSADVIDLNLLQPSILARRIAA